MAVGAWLTASVAYAFEAGGLRSGSPTPPAFLQFNTDQRSLSVAPRISAVGAPRTIFANGCTGTAILDETQVSAGRLIVRIDPTVFTCGLPPVMLNYTPRLPGNLTVAMMLPDGSIAAEAAMETVAVARSAFNLDGMWFDPDTNGSGISFHHSSGTDAIFGTWFMFGAPPSGGPRWYSLQSMQWTTGGSLLVGSVYEATAATRPSCLAGEDCPRLATVVAPVGAVSVTVIDSNSLRVEAIDRYGRQAFVSRLKRLDF